MKISFKLIKVTLVVIIVKLLTVNEVAEILQSNTDYVHKLHNAGLLKLIKVGRLKCRPETLEAFLEKYDGMDITDPFNVREL